MVGIKFCRHEKKVKICVSYYLHRSRNRREVDFEKLISKMNNPASPPLRIGKDDLLARARVSIQKHQQYVFSIFFLSYYFYSLKNIQSWNIHHNHLFKIYIASSRVVEKRNRTGEIYKKEQRFESEFSITVLSKYTIKKECHKFNNESNFIIIMV